MLCRQGEWWANVRNGFVEQKLPVAASGQPAAPVPVSDRLDPSPPDAWIDSNGHKQQHIAARSKHPGGVNTSRCDGSISFINDSIDPLVWDELCSAASGNPLGSVLGGCPRRWQREPQSPHPPRVTRFTRHRRRNAVRPYQDITMRTFIVVLVVLVLMSGCGGSSRSHSACGRHRDD